MGDIPELEPFFPAPRPEGVGHTLPLPAVSSHARVELPMPREPTHTPAYGGRKASTPPPRPPPERSARIPTPLGMSAAVTPPPPRPAPRAPEPEPADLEPEPPTMRRTDTARPAAASPAPRPAPEPARTASVPPRGESYESMFPPPRKSGRGGVMALVALLVIGGLVAVGATVGKPYIQKALGNAPASGSANAPNDRLERELQAGDRARADGDWASARDAYLRGTAHDEKSVAAWDGLCTAESELAVTHWIAALASQSALERDQASNIGASAGKSCGRWSELARSGPDTKKVSSDLRPVRALATQGDAAGVRVYLPSHPGEPIVEALVYLSDAPKGDLAATASAAKQAAVALAKVKIDTLTAPADLALVAYGASVSGNGPRREEALAELRKRAPRHVLLEVLRGAPALADAGLIDAPAALDAAADAKAPVVAVGGGGGGGGGEESTGGDYRSLDEKGHKALASGDPTKAETYFRAALAQHPGDVDALFGLGQIARSRGDHANAISYFKQVLDTSSGFAPARLALADEQWTTGDQAAAKKNYELYLDRVTEGSGADRARSRTGKALEKPPETPKDDG
ncbi:MAG: tetratricopeptide repeat protein [Polyangiales bacterium]